MPSSSSASRLARVAAAALVLGACQVRTTPRVTGVVIVTLDTTRADRLPAYGFGGVDTPALDSLARRGVVFERAMSVAPLTLPAHASLFTGVYPPRHGVRDNADALSAARPTLASLLRAHGFRTAASVGSIVLTADRGLGRGFDAYCDDIGRTSEGRLRAQRPGNEVMDDALAWLKTVGHQPFFLWVHLYDVHQPYAPPEPYGTRYREMPYLGEIAFADEQIGRLLRALDSHALTDRTAVVVAGDHGESLGDHGEEAHGLFIYESVLHVPLIVSAPGIRPRRVAAPVSSVDLTPTVLELTGIEAGDMDGISLRRLLIAGGAASERSIYAESMFPRRFGWSPLRAVRDGRFKFIDAPRPELYDLDADPEEQENLIAGRPAIAAALAAKLGPDTGVAHRAAIDPSVGQRLASLGYVAPALAAPPHTSASGRADDPKDHVEGYNQTMRKQACHARCAPQ